MTEKPDENDAKENQNEAEARGNDGHGRGRAGAAQACNLTTSLAAQAASGYETREEQEESAVPNAERQEGDETMKTTRNMLTVVMMIAAIGLAAGAANAATKYWNGAGGTWETPGAWSGSTWAAGDDAVFNGTPPGTVSLSGNVSIQSLDFASTNNQSYTISGNTLNFLPGGSINVSVKNQKHTITSAITGSPTVDIADGTTYDGLNFAPTSGTVTLGLATVPYENATGDKAGIRLGGTTTGNSVSKVINTGGHYGRVTKQGTGTWTVGDIENIGTLKLEGGTLIVNGTYSSKYAGMYAIPNGARLSGDFTYYQNDSRFGHFTVNGGGIVAPGNSVGTMTISYGTGTTAVTNRFDDGSIYEWEVGDGVTDTIHIAGTAGRTRTLDLDNMILTILDAGGTPAAGDQLPVFTYDPSVTIDMAGFGNTAANFDTTALGAGWTASGLALTDNGAGTIYLTGLSNTAPAGDIPEPATMCALGLAVCGLGGYVRKRRRA